MPPLGNDVIAGPDRQSLKPSKFSNFRRNTIKWKAKSTKGHSGGIADGCMGSYMGAKGKCRGEFGQKWGTALPKNRSIVPFLGCFMERHFFFGLKHEIVKISLLHLPYFIHFAER